MTFDRFRIGSNPGWGRLFFEVRVFDTKAEMLTHYARAPLLARVTGEEVGNADGLCCPRATVKILRRGREVMMPRAGFLLLNHEHLNPTVIMHECLHAALTIYRWATCDGKTEVVNLGGGQSDRMMAREEYLCYLHGHLVQQLDSKLAARGHW